MIRLNIHEVKAQLSKYIEKVEAGETVVVCRRNIPVAEIRRIEKRKKVVPEIGWAAGQGRVLSSFFEPTSNEDLRQWEGDQYDPLRKYGPKREAPAE